MGALIWGGAALTALGLAGIVASLLRVLRARRQATGDADLRDRIRRILPLNLGALLLSVLGLMMVIVGVILG